MQDSKTYTSEKFITLNNGTKIHRIGFGTYKITGTEGVQQIKTVVKAGYRHLDTATLYGNEKEIGQALQELFAEGVVKREDLYVTTKVWNTEKSDVQKNLKNSLKDLQLDYVDLYLIHWPVGVYDMESKVYTHVPLHKVWRDMEECVRNGLTKSIGVSNMNTQLLLDLLSYAEIKPVMNQIELHPYLNQERLVKFCQANNVHVTAFSPLAAGGSTIMKSTDKILLKEPAVVELAEKYKKSPAQIVLNWHLSRNHIIIPKAASLEKMTENLESDSFVMSEDDLKKVSALNCGVRLFDPSDFDYFNRIPAFD